MREYIYELRVKIDDDWYPFYVGRTNDPDRRIGEHRSSARNADESSTLVYKFIHDEITPYQFEWNLFVVDAVSEDQHIMDLLRGGVKRLMNMKKGDPAWLERRIAEAADMNNRGISDYRVYRKTIEIEEQLRAVEAQQQLWLIEGQDTKTPDPRSQLRRFIIENVRVEANERSTVQVLEDLQRQQRAAQREQAVRIARADQIAQWELTNKTGENK